MATNYDKIAGIYDFVSRIVFGNTLRNAQISLLDQIPANSRLLIVGGGTGWILEEIAKIHSQGLQINYVESSAKMIALSRQRSCADNAVDFINLPAENYIAAQKYDVILTAFFFDNFSANKVNEIFILLNQLLRQEGKWLYVDFVYDKNKSSLWQKILLKTMYLFFRITTRIETQELVNMDTIFDSGYIKISESFYFHRFVRAIAYQKK